MRMPDLSAHQMSLDAGYVRKLLGIDLEPQEIANLLERMRFGAKATDDTVLVNIPSYRSDILHPIDLVEDVAIAYGYMEFEPQMPKLFTIGKPDPKEVKDQEIREILVGLGFREVKTLILTNKNDLFTRMNVEEAPVVEAEKPVSEIAGVARNWLLPNLMTVLEKNRNREYPQQIFEVGQVLDGQGRQTRKLAGVIAYSKTNFSQAKSSVAGVLSSLGKEAEDEPTEHPSFITGRCAKNQMGYYGELSPQVLENFGLNVPVCAFELTLE